MTAAPSLIRQARLDAGLTQAELAERAGLSQPAVARLERPGANPTVAMLDRTLRAAGRELALSTSEWRPSVDESLIRQQLELTPAQRIARSEAMYREARAFARAGERRRASARRNRPRGRAGG